MIPVRVNADLRPVLASPRIMEAHRNHPVDPLPCPVCDEPLGEYPTILVFVGSLPGDSQMGAAIPVHVRCTGYTEEEIVQKKEEEVPALGSDEPTRRRNRADMDRVRDQAHRYMKAVYGDDVFYVAPEQFPNVLVQWMYAVATGAYDFADTRMTEIERMAAEQREQAVQDKG